MKVGGQHHDPAALPPGKRPRTYCTGGRLVAGKSRPQRDSIAGPSNP